MKRCKIYVCYTVMHLYISVLKVIGNEQSRIDNILVLTDHISNVQIFYDELIKISIFYEIVIIEDKKLNDEFRRNLKNALHYREKVVNYFESKTSLGELFNNYSLVQVYLFLDTTRTSHYFMFKYSDITLVEDGLCLYVVRPINVKEMIKKKIFGFPYSHGRDVRIMQIEASMPEKLPKTLAQKSVLLNLQSIQKNLTYDEGKRILNIFLGDYNINVGEQKKVLILTGPYSEEGIISEQKKIELYNKIIQSLCEDHLVYIKPHPREKTDYNVFFSEKIIVMKNNFPIELLNFIVTSSFEKCITIESSALNNLTCVREKIRLGIEYDKELFTAYKRKYPYYKYS